MAFRTLIQVDELRQHLGDADFVIFDCRHDLMKPDAGAQAYAQSHIPGARFAHSDKDLSGPKTGKTGRHPLPEPGQFMAWLGANGVDGNTQVVAYDYAGGASATRLWWMLRWLGHDDVAVLDGGWEAWIKAGAPVTADLPVGQGDDIHRSGARRLGRRELRAVALERTRDGDRRRSRTRALSRRNRADRSRGRPHSRRAESPVQGQPGRRRPLQVRPGAARGVSGAAAGPQARAGGAPVRLRRERLPQHPRHGDRRADRLAPLPGSWSEWCADPARPIARG